MVDYFDLPGSMSYEDVCEECECMSEEKAIEWLAELAAHVYKCPDKCDEWATTTYNDFEEIWNEQAYDASLGGYDS